ncbi:MAG: hypothetical protein JWQ33_656, partial [Ramlibacter sp.]|nr:hypothetical protein [Ramlibacter sp.]
GSDFMTRLTVMTLIALVMTVGVYGIVAGIVKLDDLGLFLSRKAGAARTVGEGILASAPWLMKALSVAGTAAMFLVGGGILVHGIEPLAEVIDNLSGGRPQGLLRFVLNAVTGVVAGAVVLAVVTLGRRLWRGRAAAA